MILFSFTSAEGLEDSWDSLPVTITTALEASTNKDGHLAVINLQKDLKKDTSFPYPTEKANPF